MGPRRWSIAAATSALPSKSTPASALNESSRVKFRWVIPCPSPTSEHGATAFEMNLVMKRLNQVYYQHLHVIIAPNAMTPVACVSTAVRQLVRSGERGDGGGVPGFQRECTFRESSCRADDVASWLCVQ